MTRLSVNINKIATLRNARGGNIPNVLDAAIHCQNFGAEGITVHPRPDERHIRYQDVYDIKPIINTEFNIEGYPSESFIYEKPSLVRISLFIGGFDAMRMKIKINNRTISDTIIKKKDIKILFMVLTS